MTRLRTAFVLLFFLLLTGCDWNPWAKSYPFECQQPLDQIVSIEIMYKSDYSNYNDDVPSETLKVIDPSEYAQFLDEIAKLDGGDVLPPFRGYGYYYIRITYRDQMYEIVSYSGSGFYYPDGRSVGQDYTFGIHEEYMAFINKWVDAEEPLTEPR